LSNQFQIQEPPINIGADISVRSFEIISKELENYPQREKFDDKQLEVASRLIHTTSCFEQVLNNLWFSEDAIPKIQKLLQDRAVIVLDVNMIKSGISDFYLKKYGNEAVCYVNEPFAFKISKEKGTTRSYAAVVEAIKMHRDRPIILACGNAPTFIYAAINTLIEQKIDLSQVALLLFPVGFVNVVESKEYAKRFSEYFDVASIIMMGRFGGSPQVVATLHAIYKLIKDYDGKEKYNGK